jgi:hypothetical protein
MSQTNARRRLPVGPVNLLVCGGLVAAGIAQLVAENVLLALCFIFVAFVGFAGALYARRADSKDTTRVNAIEYRDERDRVIAQKGFAIVGAAALLVTVAQILGFSIFAPEYTWIPAQQMIFLAAVWGVGNQLSANRT